MLLSKSIGVLASKKGEERTDNEDLVSRGTSNWKVLRLPVVQELRPQYTDNRRGAPASRYRTASARPHPPTRSAFTRSTACDTSAQWRGGRIARGRCTPSVWTAKARRRS